MGNRLYVANVPFAVTSEKLAQHFSQAGSVTDVQIMMDKITGRPRGIAFVTMGSDDDARQAIERLNGQPCEGRPLTVNEARPREDRAGGPPPRRSFDAGGGTSSPPSAGTGFTGAGNGGGGAPRRVFSNDRRPARGGGSGRGDHGGRKDKERDFERDRAEKRARRGLAEDDDSGRRFARGDFGDDDEE